MRPKLLILDDQPQYLRSLERALRADFDVMLAAKLSAAKEMMSDRIALVLTDIRLDESQDGDRQGIEFIGFVHMQHPEVPIIAMSALDMPDVEMTALAAGATQFIKKPVVVSRLRVLIDELIKKGNK